MSEGARILVRCIQEQVLLVKQAKHDASGEELIKIRESFRFGSET